MNTTPDYVHPLAKNFKEFLHLLLACGDAAVLEQANCAAVGIIGGADGPTAIVFGGSLQGKLCTACSALHFEPAQHDIEWRITFHEKRYTDFTLMLLFFQ